MLAGMTARRAASRPPSPAALITGASNGIGREISRALAQQGYDLTLVGRDAARLASLAGECEQAGAQALCVAADLREAGKITATVDRHVRQYQRLDVLVNCAGVLARGAFAEEDPAQFSAVLEVNLLAPMRFCHAAHATLRRTAQAHGRAVVINLSSISGKKAYPDFCVYTASKFGLAGFSAALEAEWRPAGIAVCTLFPGVVNTGMGEWAHSWMPPADMLQPGDIADVVCAVLKPGAAPVPPELLLSSRAEARAFLAAAGERPKAKRQS
jgi:short-subunit dehydrogenase